MQDARQREAMARFRVEVPARERTVVFIYNPPKQTVRRAKAVRFPLENKWRGKIPWKSVDRIS